MKRTLTLALAAIMLFSCVALASAATEVKMTGDARVWGNWWNSLNYTGWNAQGTKTYDSLTIWERFRLRTDFIANEGLKFRFGIRVNNKAWGADTFTVDNPAASIDVYQAYMQFKVPGSEEVEFTVGLQPLDLPISSPDIFGSSPILGNTQAGGIVASATINENFKAVGGFTRLVDTDGGNGGFAPTTTRNAPNLDAYFLVLPITVDGFSFTPWGVIGVAGKDAAAAGTGVAVGTSPRTSNQNLANNLLAPGIMSAPGVLNHVADRQYMYWWIGGAISVTALDPFKFYADIMYGSGMEDGHRAYKRAGWFVDAAAEYTGLDMMTPQLAFWYSSGEDKSMHNGSERMPTIRQAWGPSNSFLFDSTQAMGAGYMGLNPTGSWGFALSLNKISFVQDLTHRLTFTFAQGTNAPRALRQANVLWGDGNYAQMGRDLTTNEYVLGINFDNQYNIYENLAAILETGWSHLYNAQGSVWNVNGRRFTQQINKNGDAWKVALGLQYKF
jgi:opacity protein-like surface antigen